MPASSVSDLNLQMKQLATISELRNKNRLFTQIGKDKTHFYLSLKGICTHCTYQWQIGIYTAAGTQAADEVFLQMQHSLR